MAVIKIITTDSVPLCPHCDKELNVIECIEKGIIEQTVIYICPHCKKILSIGYNLGW